MHLLRYTCYDTLATIHLLRHTCYDTLATIHLLRYTCYDTLATIPLLRYACYDTLATIHLLRYPCYDTLSAMPLRIYKPYQFTSVLPLPSLLQTLHSVQVSVSVQFSSSVAPCFTNPTFSSSFSLSLVQFSYKFWGGLGGDSGAGGAFQSRILSKSQGTWCAQGRGGIPGILVSGCMENAARTRTA